MNFSAKNDKYGFGIFQKNTRAVSNPFNPYDGSTTGITAKDILLKLDAPLQIQWTVSRRCNFQCPHCFNNSGPNYHGYEAPRDAIIENVCDAKPYNICLCGGEPFFWDDLFIIIKKLRDGGIPFVGLVTNAYLVTPEKLRKAVDAGLNSIQISFDGFKPEDHAVNRPVSDSWDKAYHAIEECAKYPVFHPLAVSFIPNRINILRFKEFVSMAIDIGCKSIRVQPLMSSGRASYCYDELNPTSKQYLWLKLTIKELENQHTIQNRDGVNLQWGDPLEHIWFFSKTDSIPQFLSIQTNGWYEVSPYLPILFGDSTKHSIKEFWRLTTSTKEFWQIPVMRKMADQLATIEGMREVEPRIYFEDHLMIERFDEENWALAEKTDDVNTLVEYARNKGYYNYGDLS
ncbi:MAG: radical SAM protein [Aliifodinibius sp.]|nr:radical SAM protein [Fodinibius sp.]NIV10593.1 radical SAM protein [Fodinibius sp.]NIY24221.1 radical SAM protein [Fodinibius sp.]